MQKTITHDHVPSYADPIAFKAGDQLRLNGKTDVWDGHTWLWAEGPDGKNGWIRGSVVESKEGRLYANRDYSAAELTCSEGETLTVMEETHGWARCCSSNGDQGWVPLRNLSV